MRRFVVAFLILMLATGAPLHAQEPAAVDGRWWRGAGRCLGWLARSGPWPFPVCVGAASGPRARGVKRAARGRGRPHGGGAYPCSHTRVPAGG